MRAQLRLSPLEQSQSVRNASDLIAQTDDIEEFEASVPKIRELLTIEQELYDLVAREEER